MKKLRALLVLACIFLGSMTGIADAKSVYHTYSTGCQIKVSGFEHWGNAASSTRDNNAACWAIQTLLYYKDGINVQKSVRGDVEYDGYTKKVAGFETDWVAGYGRSPSINSTWHVVIR